MSAECFPSPLRVIQVDSNSQGEETSWSENVVASLLNNGGVALVDIPDCDNDHSTPPVAASAFHVANVALDLVSPDDTTAVSQTIRPSTGSAHATGYHPVGGMSQRYNEFREGFVWSDGESIEIANLPEFSTYTKRLEMQLHALACSVIRAVATHLGISSADWFEVHLGPTQNSSQWHIKRFAPTTPTPCAHQQNEDDNPLLWLPTHTDPSLVSIVLHDLPGTTPGGSGFQYYSDQDRCWQTIPVSGHSVAIILVGAVLQHVTAGLFPACRHRVLMRRPGDDDATTTPRRRMAATYFLRPAPNAILQSPAWSSSSLNTAAPAPLPAKKPYPLMTYHKWLEKTARKYEKSTRKARQDSERM